MFLYHSEVLFNDIQPQFGDSSRYFASMALTEISQHARTEYFEHPITGEKVVKKPKRTHSEIEKDLARILPVFDEQPFLTTTYLVSNRLFDHPNSARQVLMFGVSKGVIKIHTEYNKNRKQLAVYVKA